MKQALIRQKLIDEEEHKDQFEGYDDKEIFGGADYVSRMSSSRSRSRSDLSGMNKSRKSSSHISPVPVPRLNIGGSGNKDYPQAKRSNTLMDGLPGKNPYFLS